MSRSFFRSFLALLLAVAPLAAQDVDAIFARYNAAVDPGNQAAAIHGVMIKGSFEVAAAGMKATLTAHQQRPKLMLLVILIEGMGEMRQGTDGTTTWSSDPMGGPRILTGAEAAAITDEADLATIRRERANFTAVEGAGEGEYDGEKCVRVKLTWKSGRNSTECYSLATGFIIESGAMAATPQGEIQTSTRFSEYKSVGGVMRAHRTVTSLMGIQQVVTFTEITVGTQDPKLFELPPAIRALRGTP